MEALGFSKSVRRTFHDTPYVVAVNGDSESLKIEVEHAEDGRRWRAKFAASFIEEITQRTGNAKKFDIFVRMMLSALAQESDAVYLDVLTARDLEMLRRHANPQGPPTTSTAGQSDKRYLILTYRAEFDKVHYPLPLPLDDRSDEESLRAVIGRLRADLSEAHKTIVTLEQRAPVAEMPVRDDDRISALERQNAELDDALRIARREADQLRAELRLKRSMSGGPATGGSSDLLEASKLKGQIGRLQAEIKAMKEETRQAEIKHKREADQLTRDLRSERQKGERLQAQLRRVEGAKPHGAASVPTAGTRSRPTSRSPSNERARPPSRPLSRPVSQSPSRPNSRPQSRTSSVASSRERTPSPGRFLDSGGGRRFGQAPRVGEPRPWPQRHSVSPGGTRRSGEQQKGASPHATLSPYRRAVSAALKRDPSPGQQRERTPSPGQQRRVGATGPAAQRPGPNVRAPQAPASPRPGFGRGAAKPAVPTRYGSVPGMKQGHAPRAAGSRGGQGPDGFGQDCYPRAGSRGPTIGPPSVIDDSDQHQLGSLSALAANLGIGPGSLGAASTSSAGSGIGGGNLPGNGCNAEAAETCDIDARLQALQSFLKQTKNITG